MNKRKIFSVRLDLNPDEQAAFKEWKKRFNQSNSGLATLMVRSFLTDVPLDGQVKDIKQMKLPLQNNY